MLVSILHIRYGGREGRPKSDMLLMGARSKCENDWKAARTKPSQLSSAMCSLFGKFFKRFIHWLLLPLLLPYLISLAKKMKLARVGAQKSVLEPFQPSILLLTNALILATIGDTSLFVCAGGENERLTFGNGRLVKYNAAAAATKKKWHSLMTCKSWHCFSTHYKDFDVCVWNLSLGNLSGQDCGANAPLQEHHESR